MEVPKFKFLEYYKKDFPQDGEFTEKDIDILFYYKTTDFKEVHTHDYWEIMVICENTLINSLDGNEVLMSGSDICMIKPSNVHFVKRYETQPIKYYNFEIRESWLKRVTHLIDSQVYAKLENTPNLYFQTDRALHEYIMKEMDYVMNLTTYDVKEKQKVLRTLIIKIFVNILSELDKSKTHDSLVDRFIDLMRKPENMNSSLKELADKLGYSSEYVTRLFKQSGLITPNSMFMKIKLNYACNLLDSTDFKIQQIVEMIGIANVNYFDKLFREEYGMTPRDYRGRNHSIR